MIGEIQNLEGIIKRNASRFNIHKLYVLPTQCIYVFFYGPQNKTAIISL